MISSKPLKHGIVKLMVIFRKKRSQVRRTTLYVKKKGTDFIIVCLYIYIDDIIYISSSVSIMDKFESQMMSEFEMSDMGVLDYFLGLEVHQVAYRIFLSQRKYARDLLINC